MQRFIQFVKRYFLQIFVLCFITLLVTMSVMAVDIFGGKNVNSVKARNPHSPPPQPTTISYQKFEQMADKKQVATVIVNPNTSKFTVIGANNKEYVATNPSWSSFTGLLQKDQIEMEVARGGSVWIMILSGLTGMFIMMIFFMAVRSSRLTNEQMRNITPANDVKPREVAHGNTSEAKDVPTIRFKNIAGNDSVKTDVLFVIDFLKNPKKYHEIGARMPKGLIFYGPPGTGKTLCAKAIAGEAGVPFFSMSGSDFVEMYVGVGARRVRDLFTQARKKAPCIVFIDEIDAVGKKRGVDNNSERDQTINALLTELDGFSTKEGIIVIAATNRLEMLDDALVRPGRFDKHIAIGLPEFKERKEILQLHMQNKKVSSDVNIDKLAKLTIGFSGAGLETLLNESAILAVNRERKTISEEDIDDAYYKVVMRGDKKSVKDVNQEQLELVAWHEAGHALVAKLLTKKSIPKVTIVPSTSGAGGVTFIIPEKAGLHTRRDLINDIQISYAGRIAEFLLRKDTELITTGASQDIKQATQLITNMIKEFGMNDEFGMLYMGSNQFQSDEEILQEAKKMSKRIYEQTERLLTDHQDTLESIANRLLERETIEESELDELVEKRSIK